MTADLFEQLEMKYQSVLNFMNAQNVQLQNLNLQDVQSLQKGDSNTRQSGDIQEITVSGAAAGSVELLTVAPVPDAGGKAQPERDWLVVLPRGGGNAIMILFVATQRHFEQIKPTFDKMLNSVQF
jgi:hypothetical protein